MDMGAEASRTTAAAAAMRDIRGIRAVRLNIGGLPKMEFECGRRDAAGRVVTRTVG
jgi:hypothetical protein